MAGGLTWDEFVGVPFVAFVLPPASQSRGAGVASASWGGSAGIVQRSGSAETATSASASASAGWVWESARPLRWGWDGGWCGENQRTRAGVGIVQRQPHHPHESICYSTSIIRSAVVLSKGLGRARALEEQVRPPQFGVSDCGCPIGFGAPPPGEVPAGSAPRFQAGRRASGHTPNRALTRRG